MRMRRLESVTLVSWLLACMLQCCSTEPDVTALCPSYCTCSPGSATLTIVCPHREDVESLSQEIDSLLRAAGGQLMNLTISNTLLTRIPDEVCNLSTLVSLRLDYNRLTALPDNCLSRLSQLKVFTASNNRIRYLQDGLFEGLIHLEQLQLSNNEMDTIGLRVLSIPHDQPSLKIVDFSYNNITSLEPWMAIRAQASPGLIVDLRHNSISRFTNAANWTYNCSETRIYIKIILEDNNIDHYSAFSDAYFTYLRDALCFWRGSRVSMDNNPMICDCLDFYVYLSSSIWPHSTYYLDGNYCRNFMPRLKSSIVRPEDLVCDVATQCPNQCYCFNQPYNSTFHVICARMGYEQMPFDIPAANLPKRTLLMPTNIPKYKLDFSGNNIGTLDARPYFNNTVILDISNSQLENISEEALVSLQEAKMIYLHDNLLRTLPRSVEAINFSFTSLSLYNNPLDCSCDQRWLKAWLTSIYDRLENSDGIHCDTPVRLRGRTISSVNESDFCYVPPPDKLDLIVLASALSASLVPMLCVALFLVVLRYRVQAYKRFRFHPFDRDECMGEEMAYDVFISYAHGDTIEARQLLEFLENNGCKVCFHQRDFLGGAMIYENILEAVYTSKRVLCLITAHFVQSEYCLDEFVIAHARNVELKRRRLIILKHDEFEVEMEAETGAEPCADDQVGQTSPLLTSSSEAPAGRQLDGAGVLREFVSRHTFISLSADSWKDQLLYAMPINRLGDKDANASAEG